MQFVDLQVPQRLDTLALYASIVAAAVIALNLGMVRFARWLGMHRLRPRGLRDRAPRS